MKKVLLSFVLLFFSVTAIAQLEVKEGSFKEVLGFVNINIDKMYDDNEKPYAVLKIRTENINSKQRRELNFGGDAQTFFEIEYTDGEVWLYISYYASFIKISHDDLSSTEFYFPFDMEPQKGYELTLVNKTSNIVGTGCLIVTTKPESDATIILNGKILNQKTPYSNDMISAGAYDLTVSKFGFEDVTQTVVIADGATVTMDIEMPYLYGKLKIESEPSGASVFIDNEEIGVTPVISDSLIYGVHYIKIAKNNLKTYKSQFVINYDNVQLLNVVLEDCPDGAINSLFSIDSTKQVYFSHGNLQYQASTKTWKFAEHQWDFIGDDNKNISSSYAGWIDLFGWGTGNDPSLSSILKDDYKTFCDWGENEVVNNKIWRTLTKEEWEYLLYDRETVSGIRYVKAIVNGINGIILLPDNWKASNYKLKVKNQARAAFNSNIVSPTDWVNKFETYGAVFLPAAGCRRMGNDIAYVGTHGSYWTSSNSLNNTAYSFIFENCCMDIHDYYTTLGHNVRLVSDAE